MSLPTKTFRMVRGIILTVIAACFLSACGYGFGADSGTVLTPVAEGQTPTLKIKNVDNPTLFPWLTHVIRAEVRDELAARKIARWVDTGNADYEITLKVESFTFRSWLTNAEDATTLYTADMNLEAIVYRAGTNEEVWRSGAITYNQSYEMVQERVAAGELTRELARRLATRMQQSF